MYGLLLQPKETIRDCFQMDGLLLQPKETIRGCFQMYGLRLQPKEISNGWSPSPPSLGCAVQGGAVRRGTMRARKRMGEKGG